MVAHAGRDETVRDLVLGEVGHARDMSRRKQCGHHDVLGLARSASHIET